MKNSTKGNLLIVDDEVQLLRVLKLTLEDYADNVFTASDGLEALAVFSSNPIHCIICDISMPGMTGIEVIKKIRESNSDVPLIFFTGHGSPELMLEAAQYGAFDFLNKPRIEGLEETVVRALAQGIKKKLVEITPEDSLSDYRKLLNDIEKN